MSATRQLGERLFAKVFVSPLRRAMRTCELAGFGSVAQIDHDLIEWDYGEYEGRLTKEILAQPQTGNRAATDTPAANRRSRSPYGLIA